MPDVARSATDQETPTPQACAELVALEAKDRQIANLEKALTNARAIGMAVGILMERHRLTADDAFSRLVQASQRSQRKVHDIATDLVYTGRLPHRQDPMADATA